MGFLDILVEEHRGFKKMLDVLDAVAGRLDAGADVASVMVSDVIDFFEIFAHRHHGKEEDVLFPLLAQHGIGPEETVVRALLTQHETGTIYTRKMRSDFDRVQAGDPAARADLTAHLRAYSELIREHIRIEDDYFYRMADSVLTEPEQAVIVDAFRASRDRMSPDLRDHYVDMIPRYGGIIAAWRQQGPPRR